MRWTVTKAEAAWRLDAFLGKRLEPLSRAETRDLIATGHVLINDRLAPKGLRLRPDDVVTIDAFLLLHPNPSMPIDVVYADDDLVILDKPPGIASRAIRHSERYTVANFLAARFPETRTAGSHPLESGLVHRLDTATSGLLLAARTSSAYTALRAQFQARTVEKQYLAVVEGKILHAGCIALPLASAGQNGRRVRITKEGNGREAVTVYCPIEVLAHHTVVRVTIRTGMRHQIRAHLAALGHPIVGDTEYGAMNGASRLYLDADALAFQHPTTSTSVRHQRPAPAEFAGLLRTLSGPGTKQ